MINRYGIELNDDLASQLSQKTYINVIAKIKLLLTMIDCEICSMCVWTQSKSVYKWFQRFFLTIIRLTIPVFLRVFFL